MITQEEIYESIDYKKTKVEVIKVLGVYKLLLLKIEDNQKPRVTGKYGLSFAGFSGGVRSSKLESYVIKKIMLEKKLEEYIAKVVAAVNKLEEDERKYIYLKFFSDIKMSDEQIMPQCHRYERGFRILKKEAFLKLSIILGIEVYKEDEEIVNWFLFVLYERRWCKKWRNKFRLKEHSP